MATQIGAIRQEQLIPVIDALYNLATFTAGQDSPPSSINKNPSIGISRVVIGAILGAEMDDDDFGKRAPPQSLLSYH
jgi:hypothetical protein